ncbi:MAG: hypothetical protein EOM20_15475 [Spartobacteria bacterium]|nr:hypothetical protein [Spartobacteria bacterium]
MKKKLLTVSVLIAFIAGVWLMPALHLLALSHGNQACAHASCCQAVTHPVSHHHGPARALDAARAHNHAHNPLTCPVCRVASLYIDVAVPLSIKPHIRPLANGYVLSSESADYIRPRLLPYACGPPA